MNPMNSILEDLKRRTPAELRYMRLQMKKIYHELDWSKDSVNTFVWEFLNRNL